jgi:hypothetical protein
MRQRCWASNSNGRGAARRYQAAPHLRERLAATGAIPVGNSAETFARQIKTRVDIYVTVAREANIRAEQER